MRKNTLNLLFLFFSVLLLFTTGLLAGFAFYETRPALFYLSEGILLITICYLVIFYRRIIRPIQLISNGMNLLKEQDFSSRLSSVKQPEADRIVTIFNKMMEQLKEERLHVREQNELLDLLISASPMGVIILTLDQRIFSVNPTACKLLQLHNAENANGRLLADFQLPLAKALTGIPLYGNETVRLNDANIYKCTHASFIDRGFPRSFFLIEELTQEVFKAEKKAYEKVIRLMAHEVNNTTAGLTSSLDTIDSILQDLPETADLSEVLRVAIERCYSMNRFITRFADVVRIPEPQFAEYDLNETVHQSIRFMETLCLGYAIKLLYLPCSENPKVRIDTGLFEQVLVNIIKNACESIEKNGTITIKTHLNPVRLEIADTGKGIDKETESKLFTPFFSTKPDGQGLGLIFIREVLQKQNCTFSLRTEEDGQTRFLIRFPTL